MDGNHPPFQEIVMYQTPPASRRSRGPLVAAGVALVAIGTAGAALLVAGRGHHEAHALPVRHTAPGAPAAVTLTGSGRPSTLDNRVVENDLYRNEGQTEPECNHGAAVPAQTGREFVCTSDTTVFLMRVGRITVDSRGNSVAWDVVSRHARVRDVDGILSNETVEKFLMDLSDAVSPVCNDARPTPAKVGADIVCVDGHTRWTVRITAVDPDGAVHYTLID